MHVSLTRRQLIGGVAALSLTRLPTEVRAQQTPTKPNVVIILADDQGWGDLSIHGNTNLSTPNIDSLARDGALFDRFYVSAVCAPTRAQFLTGRYHARGGVRGVSTGAERLNTDEHTIAQTFQASGYATAAFGKWHNGTQFPYHPNARGFDEYYGFTSGHWGQYFDPELDHNGELVRGKGYITDDLTDHAIQFIRSNRQKPFFCYIPYNTPHSPMQVPDKYFEKFSHFDPKLKATNPELEDIGMTRAALAMCENIDWNVGRVLKTLDDLKLAGNTIVLYFSDNGPNSWRWNGGMKGRKGSVDEGGVRAPFLIRWPGHIPQGRRVPQIAAAIDLLPTLADLVGIPVGATKPLDGQSLKPLLMRDHPDWPDRRIFSLQNQQISVRTQRYRLDAHGALYDMVADPGQTRDVSAAEPAIAAQLRAAASAWGKEMLPLVGKDDRPFPVGYGKLTILPARDGVAHGNIRRSAEAPNCSFFTNWTSKDDRLTWDIEIGQPADFEIWAYYSCPPQDIGSTIEFRFLDTMLLTKVAEPWDPPLIGKAFDRVPRQGESYVKDWKRLTVGRARLPQGRAKLTLRALEIAKSQVADIRAVFLTRL